jgi:hypothetical protein
VGNSSNDSSQPRGFEIEKLGKSLLSIEGTTGTLKVPKDFVVNGAILEKGNTLFPLGAILVYRGTASSIPRGWVLCNGQNGTPNLVGKFIKGASAVQNKANIDKTATSNSHNHSYHAPPVPIDLSHVHPGGNYGKTKNLSTGSPMGGLVAILPTDRIQRNERQTEPSRIHTHKRSPSDVYVPKMVHSEIRNHDLNLTVNSDSSVALPPYMDLYYIMKVNNLE